MPKIITSTTTRAAREKLTPGVKYPLAKSHELSVSLCLLLARFGCCLATRRASALLSKHGVADLASKQARGGPPLPRLIGPLASDVTLCVSLRAPFSHNHVVVNDNQW